MTLVLDAGAFVAVERADRDTVALLKRERLAGRALMTHGGVIGQVWRGEPGGRQTSLGCLAASRSLAWTTALGGRAGVLLGVTDTSDVIDAAVVLLASNGDEILTSDPDDLRTLAEATGAHVELLAV